MSKYEIRKFSEIYVVFGLASIMMCMVCIFVNTRKRTRIDRQNNIRRQYTV
jgi:uncharacterized membrane protein YuzA (DUF378 family)